VSPQLCSAYSSFVGLDPAAAPATWGDRLGLELQWATPREPLCRTQADCEDGGNATCSDDPLGAGAGASALKRCFCIPGLVWNPLAGVCLQSMLVNRWQCYCSTELGLVSIFICVHCLEQIFLIASAPETVRGPIMRLSSQVTTFITLIVTRKSTVSNFTCLDECLK
jgi:hypothetical protein